MNQNREVRAGVAGRSPARRKRKWRCSFCGLHCHGTRRGILRCITRALRTARTLGIPDEVAHHEARESPIRYAVNFGYTESQRHAGGTKNAATPAFTRPE